MGRPTTFLAAAVVAAVSSLLAVRAQAATRAADHFSLRATVVRVVDGDTIDVALATGGRRERVRLLGIDAPERGACYAATASAETARLTLRKSVRLVGDRSQA